MAWKCQRCERKLFKPRDGAHKYAMEWRYVRKYGSLTCELRRLQDLDKKAIVTHAVCPALEVDGFVDRVKAALRIPAEADHPLLI